MYKAALILSLFCSPFYAFCQDWYLIKKDFSFPSPKFEENDILIKGNCPKYSQNIEIVEIDNPVKGVDLTDFSALKDLSDDLSAETFAKAAQTNIRYWEKKPSSFKIKIGASYYSKDQMLALNKRLLEIFSSLDGNERLAAISKEFKIYKAVSDEAPQTVTITGYYESEILVSKTKKDDFIYPLHKKPEDLIKTSAADNADFDYGRIDENGKLVPYYSTEEIRKGAIDNKNLEIAYSNHPSHIMLAQIQGSSIIKYENGDFERIGFAAANGRKFASVQKVLIDCKETPPMSFKNFIAYLSSQPQDREERLVNINPRYIFFSLKDKNSLPYGAMGYELTDERSVAIDPAYIPLGVIGYIKSQKPYSDENGNFLGFKKFSRFIFTQDTGSAIRGAGRIDLFWGNGKKAETEASSMKTEGEFYIFAPKQ